MMVIADQSVTIADSSKIQPRYIFGDGHLRYDELWSVLSGQDDIFGEMHFLSK